MTEPLRLLNLYKERLRLLENKDNKLGLCRDSVNNPQIPNYKKRELLKNILNISMLISGTTKTLLKHYEQFENFITMIAMRKMSILIIF